MSGDATKQAQPKLSIFKDSTPGPIKTLRRKFRRVLEAPDSRNIMKEQMGQSDRAAVLITAAFLDDVLAIRIASTFKFDFDDTDFEKIFRFEGPLGTFSARLEMALLFGVIEDETFQQLNIVRELRNACAHSTSKVNLEEPEFANVVGRLIAPPHAYTTPEMVKGIRRRFILESTFLTAVLTSPDRAQARAVFAAKISAIRATLQETSPDRRSRR